MAARCFRSLLLAACLAVLCATSSGCQWYEKYKGPGFPGWDESGSGFRGKDPNAKASGFLYDKRSEQIEKSLGGSF